MTPKRIHILKLAALTATLWTLYLVPWLPLLGLEPLKPTLISVAFAVLAHRLRVAAWPVVLTFSLSFFVEGIAEVYFNSPTLHNASTGSLPDNRIPMLALWAVLFSPISLWGPVLSSALTYGVLRRKHDALPPSRGG
jgi:hypothetical protein